MAGYLRPAVSALIAATLASSTGCTVLGVAIGSAIPRSPPPDTAPRELHTVPIGSDVEVDYVDSDSRVSRVEGVYRGADSTHAYVESHDSSYTIPL
jgi:hypothetical protein